MRTTLIAALLCTVSLLLPCGHAQQSETDRLALAFALPAADKPAAPASAEPTPLRIAVLPFQNAIGDAASDDWRQALPELVRWYLVGAEFTRIPGWKKLQPALVRAGWTAAGAVDARLARQIAQELNADVAVWGSFRRQTNCWAVDAKLLRIDTETASVELHFTSPRWVDLAESLALSLAKQLDLPIATDERRIWKLRMTDSEKAAGPLAKALALEIQQAPASDKEKAWRAVLDADQRCGLGGDYGQVDRCALADAVVAVIGHVEHARIVYRHAPRITKSCGRADAISRAGRLPIAPYGRRHPRRRYFPDPVVASVAHEDIAHAVHAQAVWIVE